MIEDEKSEIIKFLDMRKDRINEIEIAIKLYIKIGELASPEGRVRFSDDSYDDGCVYQFFGYMQQMLFHFIFNNFHTIIGNYDQKKDCLKSWEKFQLCKEEILLLMAIRGRYSEIRNNLLAHLSTSFKPDNAHEVSVKQIEEDISHIRGILNSVRKLNGIPIVIQSYDADKHYSVEGIQKLFELIISLNTNMAAKSS